MSIVCELDRQEQDIWIKSFQPSTAT
uniref:Uncharacterized protein n=1 Tax=Arundo donax TaxID=35708 RepID=A0A0A9AM08_ARUDO